MNILLILLFIATVSSDPKRLYIDQMLSCDIQVSSEVDASAFLDEIKKKELSSFSIVSASYHAPSTFSFVLQPTRLGQCVFAPGFITSLPEKKRQLLPALEAATVTTGLSSLNFLPLLPLYPEKKIGLSVENQLRLLSPEVVQRGVLENSAALLNHRYAWALFVGALIVITFSVLGMWALIEYEIARRAKNWLLPKKDPVQELWDHVRDTNVDVTKRWESLAMLIKLLHQEEPTLKRLLERAEVVLYASSPTTEKELNDAANSLTPFFQQVNHGL